MTVDSQLEEATKRIYRLYDALDESWRGLDADSSLSDAERKTLRQGIEDQEKALEFEEAKLTLGALQRRDAEGKLADLIAALNGAVAEVDDEVERLRRAAKVAGHVRKVLKGLSKAVGVLAKIAL